MLITGGLNDPRVTYWEPAKWAAKLRATKTDDNLLLLKINMGAGHGGKSGRWERLHEIAEAYAFVLTQMGGACATARFAARLTVITAIEADIDELGHVNNAVWVRWIQDIAVAHWQAVAPAEHRDSYVWVVTRHEIDYLRAVAARRDGDRADLGRRGAEGRAVRPACRVRRRRRQDTGEGADDLGDPGQGNRAAVAGAGGSGAPFLR